MNISIRRVAAFATFFYSSLCGLDGSQTFRTIRPVFQTGTPERNSLMRVPRHDHFSFIQATPLFSKSVGADTMMGFYLPYNKTGLFVAEDGAINSDNRNVAASNLNIKTAKDTFSSLVNFKGHQTIAGIGVVYRQQFMPHWWFEIGAPLIRVDNVVTLDEKILEGGGGGVHETGLDNSPYVSNVKEAFRQPSWKYGRIISGAKMSKWGIADIEFKIGVHSVHEDWLAMIGYLGAVFPTGNKPQSRYMFEPIVGNNHHYGILYGTQTCIDFWRSNDHILAFNFNFDTRYLIHNFQTRSFDLNDKQFSRYIETYKNAEQAEQAATTLNPNSGTSGINVFTQKVKVAPRFQTLISSALLYDYRSFEAEVGYLLSVRQQEKIDIIWKKTAAVKDVGGVGATNRARTIRENFSGSFIPAEDYTPLTQRDLNLSSAGQPTSIGQTFFAALGYYVLDGDYPTLIGLGGSYEFGIAGVFDRWMMWGNLSVSY